MDIPALVFLGSVAVLAAVSIVATLVAVARYGDRRVPSRRRG